MTVDTESIFVQHHESSIRLLQLFQLIHTHTHTMMSRTLNIINLEIKLDLRRKLKLNLDYLSLMYYSFIVRQEE